MDRRRALSQRPATSEEIEVWSMASKKIAAFRDGYNDPSSREAIDRVNRSISAWPSMSGEDGEPMESFETVKKTYEKISKGLGKIKSTADAEVKAIDEALDALSILMAMRKAPENPSQQDKRKRNRAASPLQTPATSTPTSLSRLPMPKGDRDRASEGSVTSTGQTKSDSKSKLKFYHKQFPLQPGRKVAFFPVTASTKASSATGAEVPDQKFWMLAVVTRCINQGRGGYEVQDAEMQDDGQPGQLFTTIQKYLMPLADPDAAPNSPMHPSSYPDFPAGHFVLALYPDTSCFYRAKVAEDREKGFNKPYRVRFDDDEDQTHTVPAHWVVDFPGYF